MSEGPKTTEEARENDLEELSPHAARSRRRFLSQLSAVAGGGAATWHIVGCGGEGGDNTPAVTHDEPAEVKGQDPHVGPGQLDDYYGFWSGGQSGEIRILGVPSMRELKRIPVFNRESATGWGQTDFSKKLLGGRMAGDTHHVHLSYNNGTYDGRYVYVNDKMSARLARVRIATMEVDKIVDIPNSQGTHGIFPQRHKTGLVVCNGEFRIPQPNTGNNLDDPTKYASMHTAIDGETMELQWQVMVEGNLDLAATDYEGKYSFATCYNSEGGVTLEEMMGADQDFLYVFNLANIKAAVEAGKVTIINGAKVLDARGADGDYILRVPVPKSPHGVNVSPDGKYAIVSGKLSPTCSVVQIDKLASAFAGEIKPRDCVVAEPEVGLGPLHTAFDGKGNAYTSIFIDSVMTKWNIDDAIKQYSGDTSVQPIRDKVDVHYQVGHTNASMSETKEADGKWLVALCKFSKDRYLNVGMLKPENDQLIDMTMDKLAIVHDGPAYSEPHDAVIVRRDLIKPLQVNDRTDDRFTMYEDWAKEDGVDLMKDSKVVHKGQIVRVYMTSQAPKFGLTEFRVKAGAEVQIIQTNIDNVDDLSHGLAVCQHDVNMLVNPQDTQSVTFTASKTPGVYWYYCSWFCHALHLEMRGRMIVEA